MSFAVSKERGNVLFLILIAVALFAALSYAVSTSMRSGGGNDGEEKSVLSASRLLNFGSTMQAGIDRMRISGGVDISEIYVENNGTKWWDDTARYCCLNTIPTPSRGLFHPDGGGVVYQAFEDLGEPFSGGTKAGHTTYVWTNQPGIGSSEADMVMWTVALKQSVCEAINKKVGISVIPTLDFHENDFVTGVARPTISATTGSGADLAAIEGKTDFCFRYGDGRLFYNRVLKEN